MPGPDAFGYGVRRNDIPVNVTFLRKARIENRTNGCGGDTQQRNHRVQSPFANLPHDVLLKICSYLSFKETIRLGRVCWRWYKFTKSPILWERTDLVSLNLPPKQSQDFLMKLPSCVRQLRIGRRSISGEKQALEVPAVYNTLLERFPELEALVVENSFLGKLKAQFSIHQGFMLNCKVPMAQQVRRYYYTVEYHQDVEDADLFTLIAKLQDLTILSLRNSVLAIGNYSSYSRIRNIPCRIRVLDLSYCPCVCDQTIEAFCQLPFLEELYLAGTAITVNGIATILQEGHRLKVLDLDDTIVGGETFEVLRYYGQSLVELYMGKTAVKDSDMIEVEEDTFPMLKKLCLQRTIISEIGVKKILLSVPSLTHIILTNTRVKITWMLDQPCYIKEKFKYDDIHGSEECNHFLSNKFRGKF